MATWKLSPQYKKSAVEKMFFYKDGKCITIEQGFRWATFKMESDICPLSTDELKNDDGYDLDGDWEMWDMMDGCWIDIQAEDDVPQDELEEFEISWEEDSYEGVESLGWSNDDTEYYYHGPLELTNEDTGEVFQGEPDEPRSHVHVHMSNTDNPVDFPAVVVEEDNPYTDWFPADINPVRVGTYQVLNTEQEVSWPFQSNILAGTWDGKTWDIAVSTTVVKWRGLNKEPK
mgnify:CR=1 FL=1